MNQTTSASAPGKVSYESLTSTSGRITWTAVTNAAKYDVQISTQRDFATVIGKLTITGTSVKVTGMSSGNTYYVRVRAVASNGIASDWAIFQFKPATSDSGSTNPGGSGTAISAPTGLTVSTVDTKSRLKWNSVYNAANYTVEIYSDASYTTKIASLKLGGTSVLINGMSSGKTYYIRVNAIDPNGKTSAWTTYSYAKK